MTSLERRIVLIEGRLRMIEERLAISNPERPHFGSMHIGEKTKEVYAQELKSLLNQYKPNTMTKKEIKKWSDAYDPIFVEAYKHKDWPWIASELHDFTETIIALRNDMSVQYGLN